MARDFQHIRVPDGISKDCIRGPSDYFTDSLRLAFAARHPNNLVRDLAVLDGDSRGQNPLRRNSEMFYTCPDDPLAGGRHCPDFATESLELERQRLHVRENFPSDFLLEERGCGAHDIGFSQSAIHGHHFGAHIVFADVAGQIIGVAGTGPADSLIGNQAATKLPLKEARAGITRPERSVAVEDSKAWL